MVSRRFRDSLGNAAKRAQETRDAVKETVAETAEKAGAATTSAAEKVAAATISSAEAARGATQDFLGGTAAFAAQVQRIPGEVWDKMVPECPVPMFILPTGADSEQYALVFQFAAAFDHLKSGIFARPRLEAWAARTDGWDLEHLSRELKREFTRQFDAYREELTRSDEADITQLEKQLQSQSEAMSGQWSEATPALVKAPLQAGLACLMLNPVTGAVTWPASVAYCGLALYNGHKGFKILSDCLRLRLQQGATARELRQRERELTELEKELDSRNDAFQRAVGSIAIKTHPQLRDLYALICEVEGVAVPPGAAEVPAGEVPAARPYLESRYFLEKLPQPYRKLLDEVV